MIKSLTATFTAPGEQKVSVLAQDNKGNTFTDEITVNVQPEKAIDATFRASKNPAILGDMVSFFVDNP